ncbi:unnamed protein product, partial [Ectocarpus sp. 4 AP-2014]
GDSRRGGGDSTKRSSLRNDQRPLVKKEDGTTLAPLPAFILSEHLCNGVLQFRTVITTTTAWNAVVLCLFVSTTNRLCDHITKGGVGSQLRNSFSVIVPQMRAACPMYSDRRWQTKTHANWILRAQ